ncbi:MAG TPA: N-acetyltransferase [Acidimicrobiales bacterium]|nr:N-acetyltransferase [Acidimicrobiales bacterium]
MIRWGDESARVGPWRADGSVALVVPVSEGGAPSEQFVRRCLDLLKRQGYERVITGALSPREQPGFLAAGFDVYEQLHLLVLDRDRPLPPTAPGPKLRRVFSRRVSGALELDAIAFDTFWRLDRAGLEEALKATPKRRFRVVLGEVPGQGRRSVIGYAICGASGSRGFVQRLAVAPAARRQGIGRRLLLDGLHWLRAQGAGQIAVNTQHGNQAALCLYKNVGFREDPDGLTVLSARLRDGA